MPGGKKKLTNKHKGPADLSVRHDEYLADDFALSKKEKLRKQMTEASQDPLFMQDLQDSVNTFETSKDPIVQEVRNAGEKLAKDANYSLQGLFKRLRDNKTQRKQKK